MCEVKTAFTARAPAPVAGSENFKAMDTNADSKIDASDDPYLPYYPGADHHKLHLRASYSGAKIKFPCTDFEVFPSAVRQIECLRLW